MDERAFPYKVGIPIPEWDARHRLPIDAPVGPECKDTATIFRINSTYIDVSDQPFMRRQMLVGGILSACVGLVSSSYATIFAYTHPFDKIDGTTILLWGMLLSGILGFSYAAFRFGRDEFFSLRIRPIRFNRREKKIYAIRRRRFSASIGEGDITWEVPWNSESIFCIHRDTRSLDESYHIRHYTLDDDGNVLRCFAIGREWIGTENIEGLLSQWNYWCEYMNKGPATLPKPPLFFRKYEDFHESFYFCMYQFGFNESPFFRMMMLPAVLIMMSFRMLALSTCREHVWPESVLKVSPVEMNDPYEQPSGDTPTGWPDTIAAKLYDGYPNDPKRKMDDWHGEPDGAINAALWARDIPAAMPKPGVSSSAAA